MHHMDAMEEVVGVCAAAAALPVEDSWASIA